MRSAGVVVMGKEDTSTSSTSSSVCDCYLCRIGLTCAAAGPNPFGPDLTQPMVYYAEVPMCNSKYSKSSKRPNCFVRAFRWYTEEHHPKHRRTDSQRPSTRHMTEFATWLDSKYEEFLQQNPCSVRVSSTITACIPNSGTTAPSAAVTPKPSVPPSDCPTPCDPCCTSNRNSKLKSKSKRPWKKTQGKSKSRDRKSSEEKELHMEFIMTPKDMSRAASECFHPTDGLSGCSVKKCVKSQSTTSVWPCMGQETGQETELSKPVKFDNPPVEKLSTPCTCPTRVLTPSKTKFVKTKQQSMESNKTVACQCAVTAHVTDAATQYDSAGGYSSQTNGSSAISSCACMGPSHKNRKPRQKKQVPKKPSVRTKMVCEKACCPCPWEQIAEKLKIDVQSQCTEDIIKNIICECGKSTEKAKITNDSKKNVMPKIESATCGKLCEGGNNKEATTKPIVCSGNTNEICLECFCANCHHEDNSVQRDGARLQQASHIATTAGEPVSVSSQQNIVVSFPQGEPTAQTVVQVRSIVRRCNPNCPYYTSVASMTSQKASKCLCTDIQKPSTCQCTETCTKKMTVGAQTSDCAITLDQGTTAAVFMKIVYVHK